MLQTYQTKLVKTPEYPTNNLLVSYLNDWSRYFQSIERKLFVDMVHRDISINTLKKDYQTTYGIKARQFNSIKAQLQGKISSIKKLKEQELKEKSMRLEQLDVKLLRLLNEKTEYFQILSTLKMSDKNFVKTQKKYSYIKTKIHYAKRKIQTISTKITRIQSDLDRGIVRISFGSKDLFRKQHNLEENDFKNHSQWKSKWLESRSNQSMCLGSSDESFGNQNCQYDNNNNLTIRIADKFIDIYGKYIVIPNIVFKYGQNNIDYCKQTYDGYTKGSNPQKYCRGAMTHRFYRNEYGWYLLTTVEVQDKSTITNSRIGAMGVDFNVNFAQVTFVDRFGNPLDELKINYSMYGKTTDQITAMLGDLSKDICELGRYYKIPVYIENLKLEDTKNYLDKGVKYNKMINSFPYKKFRGSLEARGRKTGVEIIPINPRYTSFIGHFKFMRKYGFNSHGSAACVIARRGLKCRTEKISKHYKELLKRYRTRINLNKDNYKLWMQLCSIIKEEFNFNDRLKRLYTNIL